MNSYKERLLTIVIPQHSENEEGIKPLLSSLNNQIGVDFSEITIFIIGDGGYQLSNDFFERFTQLNINYDYYIPAHGPGYARQRGLNLANSHYIAYLDADDMLNTVNALWKFINVIRKSGHHEVIFSRYIEEQKPNELGYNEFQVREFNPSAAYGKWIDVQYIREHKFFWHPLLPYAYEDTFFLDQVITFSKDIYYLDSPTYTWLYHMNSIVRKNVDYNRAHLNEYIRENRLWALEVKKRAPQRLYFDVNNGLANMYRFLKNHPPLKSIQQKVSDEFKAYLLENESYINLDYSKKLLQTKDPSLDRQQYDSYLNKLLKKALFTDQVRISPYQFDHRELSIIVPFHGKDNRVLYSLLSSIARQVGVKLAQIEVIVIIDGGDHFSINLKDIFPDLNIKLFYLPKVVGPGPTRSEGLKHAHGRFVMFCDADDQLYSCTSLFLMWQQVQKNPTAQIIMAKYANEQLNASKQPYLATWDYNFGSVYPSWFNLEFLRSYKIDFHPALHRYYEDTFFMGVAFRIAKKVVFLDKKIYTHTLNPNSLIHQSSIASRQKAFLTEFCRENYYWFKESQRRFPQTIQNDLNNFIVSLYYMYYQYNLNDKELEERLKVILGKIVKYNKNFWQGWTTQIQIIADKTVSTDSAGISSQNLKKFISTFFNND